MRIPKNKADKFFQFYKRVGTSHSNVQDLDGLPSRRGWDIGDYEKFIQELHAQFLKRASTQRKETERLDHLLSDKFPDIIAPDGSVVCDREQLDDIIEDFYA